MRIPGYVYASVALIAGLLPATAFGQATVTVTTSAPPEGVTAGSTVEVSCLAEGRISGMSCSRRVDSVAITVEAGNGTLGTPTITGPSTGSCSTAPTSNCNKMTASVAWTTPGTEGTFTATCTAAWTSYGDYAGCATTGTSVGTASVTTLPGTTLPPVVQPMTGPAEAAVGGTYALEVTASDPNNPPLPLSYAWTASGGTITAGDSPSASWQAPSTLGTYDITVTVSNGASSSTATKTVNVVLATYQAGLALPLTAPSRLASGDSGRLFVVDGRQGTTTGQVGLLTVRGEMRGFASVPEPASAVAQGADLLWVTTRRGNLFKLDSTTGRLVGQVPLAGAFSSPAGIAYDPSRMTLWVAESAAARVRVISPDGTTVATITTAGGASLMGPVDVAVDSAGNRAWVITSGPVATKYLHAFDLDANYIGSFASNGGGVGQIHSGGGVTVDPNGRVYATDSFEGAVQVFERAGTSVGKIGEYGIGTGQLYQPQGLAFMANGDLAVANTSLGRVDRFGSGAPLPLCPGDADCDGLPDDWEIAHNLNPNWAGDSMFDGDMDGLNNAEELARGTNPNNADSDGDGYSDGDEVARDRDPLDPNDHRPSVAASGPADSPPGLVRLSAVANDPNPASPGCTVEWTQPAGPTVTLRADDPAGASKSFIARKPATYAFEAVAVCGTERSPASRVTVAVRNMPPLADAGRVVVSSPSSSVWLDAWASSDANGDSPLQFAWDQSLGTPTSGTQSGRSIRVPLGGEGLYGYQVTVTDRAGASASAEVPVVVSYGPFPTAVAAAFPSEAQVNSSVVLDASASVAAAASTFYWEQVAGPETQINGAGQPVASFVPAAAGRYAFDVTVVSGSLRSPPQRVDVFVAESGGSLPALTASVPSIVSVNAPVALEATPSSGGSLEYEWRQVSGPAAGLTYADRASASAVPFSPGFYVFEVFAKEGAAQSRPVRVAFEARSGNAAIPQARASVLRGEAVVGEVVYLDGRSSTGATRYRWTQIAGPWVALDAQAARTTFQPQVAGRYVFELEVDDGKVRSAPVRVQVDVLTAEGGE